MDDAIFSIWLSSTDIAKCTVDEIFCNSSSVYFTIFITRCNRRILKDSILMGFVIITKLFENLLILLKIFTLKI